MVEDMENKIRNTLNEIYFSKTKDIVNSLRSVSWHTFKQFQLSVLRIFVGSKSDRE